MATLTETAYVTRKIINLSIILLVVGIIVKIIIMGATGVFRTLFPKPPPAPTMIFGLLPMPLAQNNIATPSGGITYSLETAGGTLPKLPYAIRVYFITHATSTFGSYDRMKGIASHLGFSDVPTRTSATAWHFVDKGNQLRTLDIDEISLNFRIKYNYLSDQSLFNERNFSSNEQISSEAKGFLGGTGLLPSDFSGGPAIITYYKFDVGALVQTTSLANADSIGVTINRANIDSGDTVLGKIPVLSPDYRQGLASVLFSGSGDGKKRILEARFLVSPVDLQTFGTYSPIKADEAWSRLQTGNVIYAALPEPMSNAIVIRKVYVAYLDPYPTQSFLQPVMVFSDEKGFVAYVPLVAK